MTKSQKEIDRMYQRAMNLRDSTWQAIDFGPIEAEYTRQYRRACRITQDVTTFAEQTTEYRALLRAYKQASLNPSAELEARVSRAEQALEEATAQRDGFIAAIDLLIEAWDKALLAANLKPRQLTSENLIDLIDEYRAIGQNWKARAESAESALSTERERVIQQAATVATEYAERMRGEKLLSDPQARRDTALSLVASIRALSSLPTPPNNLRR